jgi:hypothetical protein
LTPNYNYQGHGKEGWLYIFNERLRIPLKIIQDDLLGYWIHLGNQFFVTIIKQWHPNFDPYEAKIEKVVAWVRLSDLEMEHFNNTALWKIRDHIGKTVKVDRMTFIFRFLWKLC